MPDLRGPEARRATALDFWRLLHPLPSLMTVAVAGAFVLLAARGLPAWPTLLHLLAVQACMQFSISALNDYFDRKYDAGRPGKPVASGAISPALAAGLGVLFGLTAVLLSLPLGSRFLLLTAVGLGGGLLYDAGLKYTAFSWLPFCLAFPTLPLWAWAGTHTGTDFPSQLAWVVPVAGVLVLGIHLADTIPDLAHDAQAGVRGLAHRIGLRASLALCWSAFVGAALLTLALWAFLPYKAEWYLPGLVAAVLLMLAAAFNYFRDHRRLRTMSLMLEVAAIALAIGWIGAITL